MGMVEKERIMSISPSGLAVLMLIIPSFSVIECVVQTTGKVRT